MPFAFANRPTTLSFTVSLTGAGPVMEMLPALPPWMPVGDRSAEELADLGARCADVAAVAAFGRVGRQRSSLADVGDLGEREGGRRAGIAFAEINVAAAARAIGIERRSGEIERRGCRCRSSRRCHSRC